MFDRIVMAFRDYSLIVLILAATAGHLRGESGGDVGPQQIVRLIEALGDDSFRVREAADERLEAIGEPALPLLRAAVGSADLEVNIRAHQLIARIMSAACRSPSTGMRLVFLEPGEFSMGSPPGEVDRRENERLHRVRITRPFLLGACEVTQQEYQTVVGSQPSWFAPGGKGREKVAKQRTERFPVDSVSWYDAVEFCNRLSRRDGLPPYYMLHDVERRGDVVVAARVEVSGGIGYRLPTEAEWEYACRAGTSTPYQFGRSDKAEDGNFQFRQATLYGSKTRIPGLRRTTTVGSYRPNLWGLYDMHGNVAEWCWDWYDKDYYSVSPEADPRGPADGDHRVLRGGSWLVKQSSCRSATRFWHIPTERGYYIGFRVARNPSRYMIASP